jgi:hypothetical protein
VKTRLQQLLARESLPMLFSNHGFILLTRVSENTLAGGIGNITMDRPELLWRQFELHVGLYKHYLDLTLKMNAAYYAITGAIVSYALAHRTDGSSRASLFIPVVLGFGLVLLFVYGAIILRYTRDEMISIRDELGLKTIPELRVLSALLWLSACGFFVVAGYVFFLWFCG